MKFLVKLTIAHALYAVGALQLWTRYKLRGGAVVLTYHRVLSSASLDETWSHPGMVVHRATFEKHLHAIRRHFTVMSLAQFVAQLETGQPFAKPACLITFDDGWRDTYTEAWPALRRNGLPAVVFVPSDAVDVDANFWREELAGLLYQCWRSSRTDVGVRSQSELLLAPRAFNDMLDLSAEADARGAIRSFVHGMDAVADAPWGRQLTDALRDLVGSKVERSCDRLMTWGQAEEMAAAGVSFGSHGATHRPLTTLTAPELDGELRRSIERLRERLGGDVLALSYPNGEHNTAVVDRVRNAGIRISFSTRSGTVAPGDDPLQLPRINVQQSAATAPLLIARIVGLW